MSVWDVTEMGPFVEFEAHMIWRAPDNSLVDVSPSLVGASRHYILPANQIFRRPFPGNVVLCWTGETALSDYARYLSFAHAILAPHRVPGYNTFPTVMIRSWVREFIRAHHIDADEELLHRVCMQSLTMKGAQLP